MAQRTPGERYVPVTIAVAAAKRRGETATGALAQYRRDGHTIRTQEWYRVWNAQPQEGLPGEPETIEEQPGRSPTGWLTEVQVVYWDNRPGKRGEETNVIRQEWYTAVTRGPRRMSDAEAQEEAVNDGAMAEVARRYNWTVVAVYVVQYRAVY